MKTLAAMLLLAGALSQPVQAQPSGQEASETANAQDMARQLLDQTAGQFREMKFIVPQPIPFIRAVEFYKTPVAIGDGVCSVEVITVSTEDEGGGRLRPSGLRSERRYKLIPEPSPAQIAAASPNALKAVDMACRELSTAKDFFVAEGADAIRAGAEVFRRAVAEARSTSPLTFDLNCTDLVFAHNSAGCRGEGRAALAQMNPAKISAVRPCREPPAGPICYSVTYDAPEFINGQSGWSIEVMPAQQGKREMIRLIEVRYPVS